MTRSDAGEIKDCQVLVIGGGPAGSTVSTLLSKRGFKVTLLEREHFPRYHIGESLSISCFRAMEVLGVKDKVESHGFQRKNGSYYAWGEEEWDLPFSHLPGEDNHSWQVIRSEFDEILLNHARSEGVEVHEGVSVKEVHFEDGRAAAASWVRGGDDPASGVVRFDIVVDASGRNGVLAARQLNTRRFHDVFRNLAVWGYWEDTPDLDLGPEGAIAVFSREAGWLWAIPLHDGTVSIGLVTGKEEYRAAYDRLGSREAVYHEAIEACPQLAALTKPGRLTSQVKSETDYSYVSDAFTGPGYFLIGDAAAFLDPLLSTGVHLATFSGMLAAATISSILRGDIPEDECRAFFQTSYRQAYERLLLLVSVFYESSRGSASHFYQAQLLTRKERQGLRLHDAFLNIVAGTEDLVDVTTEGAYQALSAKIRGEDGGSPAPISNHNTHKERLPESPELAIDGLYLTLEPELGLRRAAPGR
ncbi:NAD(P)/FAD-dependent oxidoreductase [Streptomyces sp. NPDC058401]|uniref:NAD(P)/FAD-dependent oxidoreductase n=1 Tax=Streptomyces sp. NPDC058401 TaxID=3346480 RepID=UPI003661FED4